MSGVTGGEKFNVVFCKCFCEFNNAGFIWYVEKCMVNRMSVVYVFIFF